MRVEVVGVIPVMVVGMVMWQMVMVLPVWRN